MKLDDEIVELRNGGRAVRVPPGTWRGYEAGPERLPRLGTQRKSHGQVMRATPRPLDTGHWIGVCVAVLLAIGDRPSPLGMELPSTKHHDPGRTHSF